MKTVVIGDKHTVLLFSFAGIEGRVVDNEQHAIEQVKEIRKDKEYGLMIVTERVAQWAYIWINKTRFSKSNLLIVEVPDKNGHIETGKSLSDFIREAVGIRI
jgi:V/A-type H+-transporting ATPase subunit F